MILEKINWRKSTKFVTLLLSSLLIATVSATIYNYMFLDSEIGVQVIDLKWRDGADNATAGTQIAEATATLTNLQGPPNGTRIYEDPVRLNNTGSAVTFDLLIDSVSGDTVNMSSIIVRIYNITNSASIENLTVWSGGSQGSDLSNLSIASTEEWRFQWEITWKSAAITSDSLTVNLKIRIPV